jgi:DNA polymerase I-like protein with 3'-5' exonuclease and polymerase domains
MHKVYGIDIECYDPCINEKKGVSWVYGKGHILCVSVYDQSKDKKMVFKGCPEKIGKLLLDPDVILVGHNLTYDIGWMEYTLKIQGKTKATLIDTMIAEGLLNEYGKKDLDSVAKKRLGIGKKKTRIEAWAESEGLRGDFRKHLKDAPWELLKEYVEDDASIPVSLFFNAQLPLLKEQGLMNPFYVDCYLIKPVLQMKVHGIRLDLAKKKENYEKAKKVYDKAYRAFERKYGKINLNSTKQKAVLFDRHGIDYNYKITVRGLNGVRAFPNEKRELLNMVLEDVPGFRMIKKEVTLFVPKKKRGKIERELESLGYMFSSNPNLDAKALAFLAHKHSIAADILEIQKMNGTITKFLSEKFDRFLVGDRIYADFNISKSDDSGTISGRFSSSNPNLQQVQSKGEAFGLQLAELCRGVFLPDDNHWLLAIDYSQIEYRLLVHYAVGLGAKEARAEYNKNPNTDYHQFVMDLTGLARKLAKNLNFGVMYGMGIRSMASTNGWDLDYAQDIYDKYNDRLPYVSATMDKVSSVVKERKYITTIGGRRARLKDKNLSYTFLNRLNQGGSADIMKAAMVRAHKEGIFDILKVHLTVHDELICSVPKTKEGIIAVGKLKKIMETTIRLSIPIVAEPEFGENWYSKKSVEDFLTENKHKNWIPLIETQELPDFDYKKEMVFNDERIDKEVAA